MRPRHPTAFETRVYAVVRRIPRGQTRSYRWVAVQLGNPNLARAVGNALHRNPYLSRDHAQTHKRKNAQTGVPCHRVIRSDGTLGGYALGPAKKRARLHREGALRALNPA